MTVGQYERPRHPILRTGERDPIDMYKRRLIYIRDGYSCQYHCGVRVEPDSKWPGVVLQLDHIIPWSAMGSDRSDNLRTLCVRCNDERSNYVELFVPRTIGVVAECYWCARRRGNLPDLLRGVDTRELDRISAFCGICSTTSWVPSEGWLL